MPEWVEILEPRSQRPMYADLSSGECLWTPPHNVNIKRTTSGQWWELYDEKTGRFYYYNASSQTTVWHRPPLTPDCDIIPLAKLQTLKHKGEPDRTTNYSPHTNSASSSSSQQGISSNIPRPSYHNRCPVQRMSSSVQNRSGRGGGCRPVAGSFNHVAQISRHSSPLSTSTNSVAHKPPRVSRQQQHSPAEQHVLPGVTASNVLSHTPTGRAWLPRSLTSLGCGSVSETFLRQRPSLGARFRCQPDTASAATQASVLAARHRSDKPSGGGGRVSRSVRETVVAPLRRSLSFIQRQQCKQPTEASRPQVPPAPPLPPPRACRLLDLPACRRRRDSNHCTPSSSSGADGSPCCSTATASDHGEQDDPAVQQQQQPEDAMHEQYLMPTARGRSFAPVLAATPHSAPRVASPNVARVSRRRSRAPMTTAAAVMVSEESCGEDASTTATATVVVSQPDSGVQSACTTADSQRGRAATDDHVELGRASSLLAGAAAAGRSRQSNMVPLHEFIMQQARVSGYRALENERDQDAGVYDEEDDNGARPDDSGEWRQWRQRCSPRRRLVHSAAPSHPDNDGDGDEEDQFADDEGASGADADSSELDEFLEEDDCYQRFPLPVQYRGRLSTEGGEWEAAGSRVCVVSPDVIMPPTTAVSSTATSPSLQPPLPVGAGSTLPCRTSGPAPAVYKAVSRRSSLYRQRLSPSTSHLSLNSSAELTAARSVAVAGVSGGEQRKTISGADAADVTQSFISRPFSAVGVLGSSVQWTSSQTQVGASVEQINGSNAGVDIGQEDSATADMERYVDQNISRHKRGLFRRRTTLRDMLSWSKEPISSPITLSALQFKKQACAAYQLVQIYMGDRKPRAGMTLNGVGAELVSLGVSTADLRDEIIVQVCRQITDNPRRDSLRRGWELLAICLQFFAPSNRLRPFLGSYVGRHRQPSLEDLATATSSDIGSLRRPSMTKPSVQSLIQVQIGHLSRVCTQRLERNLHRRQNRAPTVDEVDLARFQIFRPSVFGSTLHEIMCLQQEQFPRLQLPWILTTLIAEILRLDGEHTEGIFRVAADGDEVRRLKTSVDRWTVDHGCDAHAPAALLKQWLRELWQPLVPEQLYSAALDNCHAPSRLLQLLDSQLPELHRRTLAYLVRFLQRFSRAEVVQHTKMDSKNLAMVFAPNVVRVKLPTKSGSGGGGATTASSSSPSATLDSPQVLLENARREMTVVLTLVEHMDTEWVCSLDAVQ